MIAILTAAIMLAQATPSPSPGPSVATPSPLPKRTLSIQIESDKSTYKVGDWIWLHFSIRNEAAQDYLGPALPPWGLFGLLILNDREEPLSSDGLRFGYRITTAGARYRAKHALEIIFNNPYSKSGDLTPWAAISVWGYKIDAPGTYLITAIPTARFIVVGPDIGQQHRFVENSNTIQIKVSH